MTAPSPAQEEAERLLPCGDAEWTECVDPLFSERHSEACPAHYRPAVAAALQARDERIKVLEEALKRIDQTLCVPAAEYVPAITDAWKIIHAAQAAGVNPPVPASTGETK